MRRARHALREWPALIARLRRAARLLVLSDLDGTLIPLRARPDLAVADQKTRAVLRAVRRAPGVRLGIISGRALCVLRRAVGVRDLVWIGNHGLELGIPGRTVVVPAARHGTPVMARLARGLAEVVRPIPGALVEDKGCSLSVHWRNVRPGAVRSFRRLVYGALEPWQARGGVRVTLGKRVIEVRPPVAWDKGSAVEWLRRRGRYRAGELVYLGDDRTDEDAFRAVNRWHGISVCVGVRARVSCARWRLGGPREALELLERIAEERWKSHRQRS